MSNTTAETTAPLYVGERYTTPDERGHDVTGILLSDTRFTEVCGYIAIPGETTVGAPRVSVFREDSEGGVLLLAGSAYDLDILIDSDDSALDALTRLLTNGAPIMGDTICEHLFGQSGFDIILAPTDRLTLG